jgi:hypothetical protein
VATPQGAPLDQVLDPGLLQCTGGGPIILATDTGLAAGWPPPWCLPPTCVTLSGNRRLTGPVPPAQPTLDLNRLFFGDVLFLFSFGARMGIFKILGAILDDFATRGVFPISDGSLDTASLRDDVTALVLEAMCRQTKAGLSSTVRDRDATYRRCLGWTSDVGRPLNLPSQVNKAASQLFHRFIQAGSSFNTAKRLATAIRGTTTPAAAASLATLTEISDTLPPLKAALRGAPLRPQPLQHAERPRLDDRRPGHGTRVADDAGHSAGLRAAARVRAGRLRPPGAQARRRAERGQPLRGA